MQVRAERVAFAVRNADYSRALTELKQMSSDRKISPRQRRAIRDLLSRVERSRERNGPLRPERTPTLEVREVVAD